MPLKTLIINEMVPLIRKLTTVLLADADRARVILFGVSGFVFKLNNKPQHTPGEEVNSSESGVSGE